MQTERCVEKRGVTQTSVKEEQRMEGRGLQEGWMDERERREMWKSGASSSYRRVGIERQRHTDTIIPPGHQVSVVNWLPLTSWDKSSSGTGWLGLRRVSCVPYYTLIVSDKTKCTQKMFVFGFSSCCPTMQRTKQKVTAAKKKKKKVWANRWGWWDSSRKISRKEKNLEYYKAICSYEVAGWLSNSAYTVWFCLYKTVQ